MFAIAIAQHVHLLPRLNGVNPVEEVRWKMTTLTRVSRAYDSQARLTRTQLRAATSSSNPADAHAAGCGGHRAASVGRGVSLSRYTAKVCASGCDWLFSLQVCLHMFLYRTLVLDLVRCYLPIRLCPCITAKAEQLLVACVQPRGDDACEVVTQAC